MKVDALKVKEITDIPFLPISTFKNHVLKSGEWKEEIIFESSGTTASTPSKHYVKSVELYKKSFSRAFEKFYGNIEEYLVLALLPSYLERKGSSLVLMVDELIKKSAKKESGFFLHNHETLYSILNSLAKKQKKVLLIGVSFGLLDFVEKYQPQANPNLIVMETGGMKGRRKEILRQELHQLLQKGFSVDQIHSEYGMTELLSQAYSKGNGRFETPPWMKVLVRSQDDPLSYESNGRSGALNIIDLANIYSMAFIQTDDLGKSYADGSFEVLGRFDKAAIRGCNLMVS